MVMLAAPHVAPPAQAPAPAVDIEKASAPVQQSTFIEELHAPLPESLGTFVTLRVAQFTGIDGQWRAAARLGYTFGDAKCIDKTPTDAMDPYVRREVALSACAEEVIELWKKLPEEPRIAETIRILKLWYADKLPANASYPPFEVNEEAPAVGFTGFDFNVFLDAAEISVPIRASLPVTVAVRVGLRKDGLWGWGCFQRDTRKPDDRGLDDVLTAKSMTATTRRQALLDACERLLTLWRPLDMRMCMDLAKFKTDVEDGLFDADTSGELPLDELQDPGFVSIGDETVTEQPAAEASVAVTEGAEGSDLAQAGPTDAISQDASAASANGDAQQPAASPPAPAACSVTASVMTPLEAYEEDVQQAEKDVANCSLAVEAAKEVVKFKKAELKEAMEHLSALHRTGAPKCKPAGDKKAPIKPEPTQAAQSKPSAETVATSDKPQEQPTATLTLGGSNVEVKTSEAPAAAAGPAAGPVDPNAWRAVPISDLDLLPGLVAILAENPSKPIKTIGDLADWTSARRPLTEISKVGEAKAEKIEAALDGFWRKHPEFTR